MSDTPFPPGPRRETLAPRHESLKRALLQDSDTRNYGEARLWLVGREPHALSAFWDLREEEHPEARGSDGEGHFFLRVVRDDGYVEGTVEIDASGGDWVVPVSRANASYRAELGFFSECGVWCFLARSGTAHTPPESDCALGSPQHESAARRTSSANHRRWTKEQEQRLSTLLARDVASMATQPRKPRKPKTTRAPRPSRARRKK